MNARTVIIIDGLAGLFAQLKSVSVMGLLLRMPQGSLCRLSRGGRGRSIPLAAVQTSPLTEMLIATGSASGRQTS